MVKLQKEVELNFTVAELYRNMSDRDKKILASLFQNDGYLFIRPMQGVQEWYDEASEGEREFMANKLAKHDYPRNGKWSRTKEERESILYGGGGYEAKERLAKQISDKVDALKNL